MSKFSHVRFRLFVAWIVFLPIFIFWLFLFCLYLCCMYCFWWLWSLSHYIDESMQGSPPPLSFLDIYCRSVSYLGCRTLCIVISFLVLWSISVSSSLVRFNNGPEYLTRRRAHVLSSLLLLLLTWICINMYKQIAIINGYKYLKNIIISIW